MVYFDNLSTLQMFGVFFPFDLVLIVSSFFYLLLPLWRNKVEYINERWVMEFYLVVECG